MREKLTPEETAVVRLFRRLRRLGVHEVELRTTTGGHQARAKLQTGRAHTVLQTDTLPNQEEALAALEVLAQGHKPGKPRQRTELAAQPAQRQEPDEPVFEEDPRTLDVQLTEAKAYVDDLRAGRREAAGRRQDQAMAARAASAHRRSAGHARRGQPGGGKKP